jgi:hypothetical protein
MKLVGGPSVISLVKCANWYRVVWTPDLVSSFWTTEIGILTRVHNQDIVAIGHEHEKARNVARALYSQTERRRRMDVYFLRQHISQLIRLLEVKSIVCEIEPRPDCDKLLSE